MSNSLHHPLAVKAELLERGFIALPDFLPASVIQSFREIFSALKLGPGERLTNLGDEAFLQLSYNPYILDICNEFFGERASPMQSLTFKYPTSQSFHQDTVHFSTFPADLMLACWIALEDVSVANGTLMYVPFSHLLPTYSKYEFPLAYRARTSKEHPHVSSYHDYESRLSCAVNKLGLKVEYLSCRAGTAFIWHPRLWHGGCKPHNPTLTRFSYVTHYEASLSPIYLKHFSGLPFFPRLQNPADLRTRRPLYKFGPFSLMSRMLRLFSTYS
jgi:hypothetical protein